MKMFLVSVVVGLLLTSDLLTSESSSGVNAGNDRLDGNLPYGYIFINTSEIYFRGGEFWIQNDDGDTLLHIKDKSITLGNQTFDLIEEDYLYRSMIDVRSFDPEYGLFVLEVVAFNKGLYEVVINGKSEFIDSSLFGDLVSFKVLAQYVVENYPIPTSQNPLRFEPSNSSDKIPNFENLTFVPIEIVGEWLKVKDDKECYKGSIPSKDDIEGWIRWKEDGEFILKVAYSC